MMNEKKLRALFRTTFDALAPEGQWAARPCRRNRRPAAALALVMALVCAGALGVGAASHLRRWPSLFGGEVVETTGAGGTDGFAAQQTGVNLPEGCVAWHEFDFVGDLPEGEKSGGGLYLMEDGRVFLRRADGEDTELTDFSEEEYSGTRAYTAGQEERTATLLGSCTVDYQRYDGPATVTVIRIADDAGTVGYAIQNTAEPGGTGFLYQPETFDFAAFGTVAVIPAG